MTATIRTLQGDFAMTAHMGGRFWCSRCSMVKPREEFSASGSTARGVQYMCKACQKAVRASRPPCSVSGCGKPSSASTLCAMHGRRLRLYGDTSAVPRWTSDPAPRFWRKVSKTPTCWMWTGKINNSGYGHFIMGRRSLGQRKTIMAHRYAYEQVVGPIPQGLQIDHLCRVRTCVNPAHLEPVTAAENMRRAPSAQKTRCKFGHEYTEENTYRNPSTGRRSCIACKRLRPTTAAAGVL